MNLFYEKLNDKNMKYDVLLVFLNTILFISYGNIMPLPNILNFLFILTSIYINIGIIGLKNKEIKKIYLKQENEILKKLENYVPNNNNNIIYSIECLQEDIKNKENIIENLEHKYQNKIESYKDKLEISKIENEQTIKELETLKNNLKNAEEKINNFKNELQKMIENEKIVIEESNRIIYYQNFYNIESNLNKLENLLLPFINVLKNLPEDILLNIQEIKANILNELNIIDNIIKENLNIEEEINIQIEDYQNKLRTIIKDI